LGKKVAEATTREFLSERLLVFEKEAIDNAKRLEARRHKGRKAHRLKAMKKKVCVAIMCF
jgi:hypothetical protein